jgi:hypothetical protein
MNSNTSLWFLLAVLGVVLGAVGWYRAIAG